jgi:prepilin-type N-terminal cleavage/methylation domain-containing protein
MAADRLTTRLRDEDGFSLVELMISMALSGLVLTALMLTFANGVTGANRTQDRVDAAQRGRLAMDRITGLLDSQVCVVGKDAAGADVSVAPILPSISTANSVTFYGDLNGASNTPNKYTITYSPTAKTLSLTTAPGSGTYPNVTFGTPVTTRLADYIVPALDANNNALDVFQYFPFDASGSVLTDAAHKVTPTTAAIAGTVVRVQVNFRALSSRNKTPDARSLSLQGESGVDTFDPTDNSVCP